MKHSLKLITLVLSSFAVTGFLRAGPTPTAADVGDADSFGHAALYMGAASGFVHLKPSCTPAPTPVPPATANDDQCFVVTGGAVSFTANDICRIKLPKKATRTLIYPALNIFLGYELENTTGVFQPHGRLNFSASIDVESDVLLDPTIIDPATGLPAAGKFQSVFSYTYNDDRSMQPNDRQRLRETLVRVGNTGITKQFFIQQGVPAATVDNLFNSAMTIRMNVTGSALLLNEADITGNMRLFGD
jgi:hypothetical protein